MTERRWSNWRGPDTMVTIYPGTISQRKMRLFACNCCRCFWKLLSSSRSRQAIIGAEQYAENALSKEELKRIRTTAAVGGGRFRRSWNANNHAAEAATHTALVDIRNAIVHISRHLREAQTLEPNQIRNFNEEAIFRDIFGNPFRPVTLDPRWLTSTVLDLANAIYDQRQFDRMPILADALMDAGCDSEEIINHCRSAGPHGRGCWVVDLLTGRE